jgi:hypothetical protein
VVVVPVLMPPIQLQQEQVIVVEGMAGKMETETMRLQTPDQAAEAPVEQAAPQQMVATAAPALSL